MRRYAIFALLSSGMVLVGMQYSTSAVALPALIDDLQPPLRWATWVFQTYTLAGIVALPLAGRLTTRFGTRRTYISGVLGFGAMSLCCALAPNIWLLILARVGQGFAGGMIMPATFGIVGEQFASQRARWVGLVSSLIPLSAVLGPNIGGVIVDQLGWRWTFGFNAPLAVVLAALAFVLLPRAAADLNVRFNIRSLALLTVFATTLIYGVTELGVPDTGPNYAIVAACMATAVAFVVLFLLNESRARDPIVDLDLMRRREFMFANALSFCFGFCFIGMFSFIPLYADRAYGLSASETGVMLTPRALAMITTALLAAFLLAKTGYRKPIVISMWGQAAMLAVLALGIHDPVIAGIAVSNFAWLTLVNFALGLVFGVGNPSMQNVSLDLAPERIAAVTGLRGMFSSLGGTVGVAAITAVAARASSVEHGLEIAFMGVAALYAVSSLLVLGIPEMRRPSSTLEPPTALDADSERVSVSSESGVAR